MRSIRPEKLGSDYREGNRSGVKQEVQCDSVDINAAVGNQNDQMKFGDEVPVEALVVLEGKLGRVGVELLKDFRCKT